MAAASQVIYESFQGGQLAASVTVTFDNVTGAISRLDWTVASGTLKVTVTQAAKPDIVLTRTSSGSQAVPAGYTLTQDRGGGWGWRGPLTYSIGWTS